MSEAKSLLPTIASLKTFTLPSEEELDLTLIVREKAKLIEKLMDGSIFSSKSGYSSWILKDFLTKDSHLIGDVQQIWVPLATDTYRINSNPALEIAGSPFLEQTYCYNSSKSMCQPEPCESKSQSKVTQNLGFDVDAVKNYFELESRFTEEPQKIENEQQTTSTGMNEGPEFSFDKSGLVKKLDETNSTDMEENIPEEEYSSSQKEVGLLRNSDLNIKNFQSKLSSRPTNYVKLDEDEEDYRMMLN